MRLATWNVNSAKSRLPRLLPWLDEREPDVVCLQETKLSDDDFAAAFFFLLFFRSAPAAAAAARGGGGGAAAAAAAAAGRHC